MILIPEHLQIETINGVCTAHCTMCSIYSWTRKPTVMNIDTYKTILAKFIPYNKYIRYLTLHGYGEPLLDKELPKKIAIAKEWGFRGTGLATNCTELSEKKSLELLEAELDTVICSIDGIKKETHEAIRIGADFNKVVSNVEKLIELRDNGGFKTRILIRFIRQEINRDEYDEFIKIWTEKLDEGLGDAVIKFDIHNWGDKLSKYDDADVNLELDIVSHICSDIFERLIIYSNGKVALCCADYNGYYEIGNIINDDPIEVFNSEILNKYRNKMLEGKLLELKYCVNCSIPRSRHLKDY